MTQGTYGFFIIMGGIVNAVLWFTILISQFIDPFTAGFFGFFFFYSSLFLFLFGMLYAVNSSLYKRFFVTSSAYKNVQQATRRAFLLSILLVGLLLLQSFRILTWYNCILFVLIISVAEYIFISRKNLYGRKA